MVPPATSSGRPSQPCTVAGPFCLSLVLMPIMYGRPPGAGPASELPSSDASADVMGKDPSDDDVGGADSIEASDDDDTVPESLEVLSLPPSTGRTVLPMSLPASSPLGAPSSPGAEPSEGE